jgi:drug/metabolite transporter (DMT)-like permease
VHLALLAVQVCFASMAVAGRFALRDIPPNAIVTVRVVGGALVFWLLALRGPTIRVARGDLPRLAGCAALGVIVNQLLFVNGLSLSSATHASMLGATIPVFTATFAVLLGVERWRAARFGGIFLALAGALLLIAAKPPAGAGSNPMLGDTLIVVNCLSYALFLVIVRPLTVRYPPMLLVAIIFTIAAPVIAVAGAPGWADLAPRLRAEHLGWLTFLLAFPTVGAYALNQIAMRDAEASVVAVYIYLQPLFATVGAMWLLGERPGWHTAVAAALIFAGLWVSSRPTT